MGKFIERCKALCGQGRLRSAPFRRLPLELREMKNWRVFYRKWKEYLPDDHKIVEYLVKRFFKVLYGGESRYMCKWYVTKLASRQEVNANLINGMKRAGKGSVERRKLRDVLHASFILEELRPVIGNDDDILEHLDSAGETDVVGSCESERTAVEACRENRGNGQRYGGEEQQDDNGQEDLLNFEEFPRTLDEHLSNVPDINGDIYTEIFGEDGRRREEDAEGEVSCANANMGPVQVRNDDVDSGGCVEGIASSTEEQVAGNAVSSTEAMDDEGEQTEVVGTQETSKYANGGQNGKEDSGGRGGQEEGRGTGGHEETPTRNGSGRMSCKRRENITRWIHWRARNDMVRMTTKGTVKPTKKMKKVFDDESIEKTLKYI